MAVWRRYDALIDALDYSKSDENLTVFSKVSIVEINYLLAYMLFRKSTETAECL